ncbi:WD40 repeat-like protein, partial [Punctularia strigosozonata HHB-11173 SS5]|uniref:WD40 repeat-like protein n=1 Tax=Punctularia strigosozonata (strain HHB-11173) TaxID=741275 RepID=UPI0004418724
GHKDEICGVALSPNGRRVVTASRDKTLEVWFFDGAFEGPEQQGPLCRPLVLSGHSKSVRSVAYSSHPRHMIASGSDDCTVRIWNVESGATVQELTGHTAPVLTVAYSPDGGHVVSGSADGTIRIWYTSNVATPLILKGGFGSVRSVAYANHRDYFASGSNDGKVRVWNARTGRTMQKSVYRHDNHVTFVAFKYLGGDTYLVSGGEDKVNVWRLGMVDHKKSPFLSGIKSDA